MHHIALFKIPRRGFAIFLDSHAHAGRRAGGDHIAGQERDELAHIAHNFCHAENHSARIANLHGHAVQVEPEGELLRIGDFIGGNQPRANRAKGVAALAFVPSAAALQLVFALAQIIDHTVARNKFQCIFLCHILRLGADHNAQLHLPIALFGTLG